MTILSIKIPVYKIGKFTSFRFNNEINRGNKYKQNHPILARLRFLDKQKEQSQYDKSTALLTQDNKALWKSLTKKTFSLLSFFGITFEQDAVSIKKQTVNKITN